MIAHRNGKFPVFDGNNNRKVVNWTNFVRVLQEEVKVCCGLQSAREPRQLHVDSFEWGIIQDGHFAGIPYVKLKADHDGQKGKPTRLKNHTTKQHLAHVNHLPIIKHDGLFCLYSMLDLLINHYMPPKRLLEDVGYIFRKEALIGQIAVSFIVVNVSLLFLCLATLYYCMKMSVLDLSDWQQPPDI